MNKNSFAALAEPRALLRLTLAALTLLTTSCATLPEPAPAEPAATPAPTTAVEPAPLPPDTSDATAAERAAAIADINRDGRVIQLGRFIEDAPAVQPPANNVVQLNYEQEDLRIVFEQLGAVLNLNMIIDPTINSRVSLRTSPNNPMRYEDIWPLMRMLARNAGVTIEQAGNVYEFSAGGANIPAELVLPSTLGDASSSEVLQVTPLTYISIEAAEAVITPLLQPPGSIIRLGPANLLGIYGSPQQLERINALLAVLDDDPFANQGIQVYPLENSSAAAVAEELQGVLQLIEGEQSSYQVLGLERINAVLVVAPAARGFSEVTRWIRILDASSQEQGEQLFVYRVKNLTALNLADTLVNVFGDEEAAEENELAQTTDLQGNVITRVTPDGVQETLVAPNIFGAAAAEAEDIVSGNLSVTIVADEDTNSLLIRASPREYRQLLTTIGQLDSVPLQVLINAVIGQVQLTDRMRFGVDWTRVSANAIAGDRQLSTRFLPGPGLDAAGVPFAQGGLVLTRTFMDGSAVVDATLRALAEDNDVRLLARPTVIAMNNKESDFKVGQRVPVSNGVTIGIGGASTENIAYQDVGIVLTITPRINEDGYITLDIFQSLSSVQNASGGVQNNPTFTNQEITTTVVVADQETIALGGLIQDDATNSNTGVPYLQRIPVLGGLFSYQDDSSNRRELFIIIHPQIIRGDGSDNAQMQEFRASFSNVAELLRNEGL
ncbi:MAG: hypothetical protein RLZZ227_705 [Pseudomonadota bacterium]|jgi:general secretion pathway protein D